MEFEQATELTHRLISAMGRVIKGKNDFLKLLITALLAEGHVLVEDLPGTGKTTAVKTLSRIIGSLDFKRIQFTPDLLPYDITGVEVWDPVSASFVLKKGPVFANIILADEINRTTPKVQSALLEVMAEKQVTIGTMTYPFEGLFFVAATENPIEFEGTYPLPEAQKDRFLMKLSIGYPDSESEFEIIKTDPSATSLEELTPICRPEELNDLIDAAKSVYCDDKLIRCAVSIAERTRNHSSVQMGVSPRGSLMLIKACRAFALVSGRDYVIDQDIADLAPLVFAHRIRLKNVKKSAESLIEEVTAVEIQKIPQ
ncbi:AAA family ATPase [Spirochaeta isovalerica]|uniref:MoxR-like ATPase n=1 Tax=Spirochaeta isovalerica TaxID=150 RepID=A0A841RGW9_9SPIO|nr:AAA family ATPase [Spirochaeta isovalerica]MBB6482029.1 MoxR-like ATPase [Spirochaeta isovalerica]